jgi:hypothetical protein
VDILSSNTVSYFFIDYFFVYRQRETNASKIIVRKNCLFFVDYFLFIEKDYFSDLKSKKAGIYGRRFFGLLKFLLTFRTVFFFILKYTIGTDGFQFFS